jgi:hypothetical protein
LRNGGAFAAVFLESAAFGSRKSDHTGFEEVELSAAAPLGLHELSKAY